MLHSRRTADPTTQNSPLSGSFDSGRVTRHLRSAAAENANHPPNFEERDSRCMGRCALDFGFHRTGPQTPEASAATRQDYHTPDKCC